MGGMQPEIVEKLHTINKEFYQRFGQAFAQTRRRIQPGVRRVLDEWIRDGHWLDIGCGGGGLAQAWHASELRGSYTGIDFSAALLEEAIAGMSGKAPHDVITFLFHNVDLSKTVWPSVLERKVYDGVLAFAVLHHIPAAENRQRLTRQVAELLKPGGLFILSVWQFQHSPKLMARVQPWELAGIHREDVEEGDTLLDWRYHCDEQDTGTGLRYVHLFSREELAALAQTSGFEIIEEFESDGKGERLGLYQVWQKKPS